MSARDTVSYRIEFKYRTKIGSRWDVIDAAGETVFRCGSKKSAQRWIKENS